MAISLAKSHRDWCKKVNNVFLNLFTSHPLAQNMEAWEEAKKEIDTIPNHPNSLPDPITAADTPRESEGNEVGQ